MNQPATYPGERSDLAMTNLFGEPLRLPKRKPVPKPEPEPEPEPSEPVWQVGVGKIAYLNSGLGYDLTAGRRLSATGCFGYVLLINSVSREALIHVPPPRNQPGKKDEYFIMPLRDLRDAASVESFDENQFFNDSPPVGYTLKPLWEVNPRR